MLDTKVLVDIRLNLYHLTGMIVFANRLERLPEFEESVAARRDIGSLQASLSYSERLLKQIYQKSAAYAIKKDRVIPKKEA